MKTTTKKKTINRNKKSIEISKDITHKEPNEQPKGLNNSNNSLDKNKLIKKQKTIM